MILTESVTTRWIPRLVAHYESFGYVYSKTGEAFTVKVEHLPRFSTVRVDCACDVCGVVKNLSFASYNKSLSSGRYQCNACSKQQFKKSWKQILDIYKGTKYIPMFCGAEYNNARQKLPYLCSLHQEQGLQWALPSAVRHGDACAFCRVDKIAAYQHSKGKKTEGDLLKFIRRNLLNWKKLSMVACQHKCVITGRRFDEIHHLYSFQNIVKEALIHLDFPYAPVESYSSADLERLIMEVLRVHDCYPLGVCLTRKKHREFHCEYGGYNNTPEQFFRFFEKETSRIFLPIYASCIGKVYTEGGEIIGRTGTT